MLLDSKLEENHRAQEDLAIFREELDRVGNILLHLPSTAEQPSTETGDDLVDVNQLMSELLKLFSASLFAMYHIGIDYLPYDSMCCIECNCRALKQIIANLVKNAVEALPDAGKISVNPQGMVNHNGKSFIETVVADNGPGVNPQIQSMLSRQ